MENKKKTLFIILSVIAVIIIIVVVCFIILKKDNNQNSELNNQINETNEKKNEELDNATKYVGTLDQLKKMYEENQKNVKNAETELEKIKSSLNLNDLPVSKQQLSDLQEKYNALKSAIKDYYTADIAYATEMIKAYKNPSIESAESINARLENTKKLKIQEQEFELEFYDKIAKLDFKYYKKIIDKHTYDEEVKKLKSEYLKD